MVKAYAALSATSPLAPFAIERRAPATEDVVIAIHHCGVCHTDIHLTRNDWGTSIYPMVPGHEITGVVTEVGARVTRFRVGDRVGVGCYVDSCTTGEVRDPDREHYQPGVVMTYNARVEGADHPTHGGYSESIVVKEGYVVSIPDALPLDAAAPLLCAGITLYSPLRHWKAGPGKRVAIVGMGGLGHVGVKLAHAMGAHVTVLSQTLAKREDAQRMGADAYHATRDPETFERLAGRFDLVLNTVSGDLDWNAYLNLLATDGALVLLGMPEQPVTVNPFLLVPHRRSLSGSWMGSMRETQEMLDFCGKHGITAEIEAIAIERIGEAYERIVKSDVRYRFVIDMATLADGAR
ncbi:NAD(P)-dependent alcohol dehydrogenase [Chondromyces crocatus]|uniref:Alcohol dehydrogenase n=1 Tax=Chondromyces crocatus TaxID=52 RepID=A0A0K1EC84_CHOCO|nr:NAD(P)-dependent alcohol dehydrogenase [Chondromyces crocatus]AKT38173.1 alcohol dehydrogenase [Chondromyces crocatus]